MPEQPAADRTTSAKPTDKERPVPTAPHLVVGIGASAGGLEALELFFRHVPPDSGLAYVVVTHQPPGQRDLLPELLGRSTELPVVTATEGMKLDPDRVYISPSSSFLGIQDGRSHLQAYDSVQADHTPIDRFFGSLAEDCRDRAVGVVLSGTGTDGTAGIKAIKAAAGMVIVQQPKSTRYAGMPSAVIATGLADHVLLPTEMPRQLMEYARASLLPVSAAAGERPAIPREFMNEIFFLIRSRTGHDFSAYKTSTIQRRVQRRMNIHRLERPSQYVHYLRENSHEIDVLFEEVLISVTSFFRDAAAWDALAAGPLPELFRSKPPTAPLRAWVPGCATGEEVYTLAILMRECMDKNDCSFDVKIFGTDLDSAAIETARNRHYPDGSATDGLSDRIKRHLVRVDGGYRISREIREMAVFAPHNVIKDPPFTKLDIICCRNLFIYLNTALQAQLLSVFHYALNRGGLLFLGSSETIGEATDQFEPLNKKWKIYRRKETIGSHLAKMPLSPRLSEADTNMTGEEPAVGRAQATPRVLPGKPHPIDRVIERLMLESFCPPSVVVDERGEIIRVHGRTGTYLEPPEGQPRMNVLEMAREGLRIELAAALREASSRGQQVHRSNLRVKTNGEYAYVHLSVTKIAAPEAIRGLFMVTFHPVETSDAEMPDAETSRRLMSADPDHTEQLEREVEQLKQSYQFALIELQTANEDLRSGNEELQSTNEELQSSNEELETSKEELQSLNEELSTVNSELQSKVEELSHAYDDMQNLLNSTEVATLFLDNELNISRYTEPIKDLINLRQSDVGRPVWELSTNLQEDHLVADSRETLSTLNRTEREVARTDGVWYMMRTLPYRTTRNVIEGVVITFVSINQLKQAQSSAQWRRYFENLFNTMRHPLLVLEENLRVLSANRRFCETFDVVPEEVEGMLLYEVGDNEWNIPELRELLEEILPKDANFENFKVEHTFRSLGRRTFMLNARRVVEDSGAPSTILLALEDATETRH